MDIDLQNISEKIAIRNKIASIIIVKNWNLEEYDAFIHSIKNKSTYIYTQLKGYNLIQKDIEDYLRLSGYYQSKYSSNFEQLTIDRIRNDFKKLSDIINSIKEKLPKLSNQPIPSVNKQYIKLTNVVNKIIEKAKS